MRFLLALVLHFAALNALHAQDMSQQTVAPPNKPLSKPIPPPPTGRITGAVFCADTHRPARGAIIMLMAKPADDQNGGSDHMARVSMDGSYSLDHVPPGEYAVTAALPGYLNPLDGIIVDTNQRNDIQNEVWKRESANGTVTVRENSSARFDLELKRGAAVTGRVLYSDGSPATQIAIAVEPTKTNRTEDKNSRDLVDLGTVLRSGFTRQSYTTDDEGNFRVSGLSSGAYRIVAVHPSPNFNLSDRGSGTTLELFADPLAVRVYAGDTLRIKQARTYDLRAGDVVSGITITIPIEAFHVVSGRLSALDGRFLNAATLTLTDPSDESFSMTADLQSDGSFRFPSVPSGTYTLISSDARITELVMHEEPSGRSYSGPVARAAFADTTQSVIVKDADLNDVKISSKEVPLPPTPESPNPNATEQTSQPAQPQ